MLLQEFFCITVKTFSLSGQTEVLCSIHVFRKFYEVCQKICAHFSNQKPCILPSLTVTDSCSSLIVMWQSLEASRLQPVLKCKERAQEVNQRAVDLNESFSKETEKKLQEKMDAMQEKKKAQIQALLDRLSLHVCVLSSSSCHFNLVLMTVYCLAR